MREKTLAASSLVTFGSIFWALITNTMSVINLPSDASDAIKALVEAPVGMPIAAMLLAIGTLAWSVLSREEEVAQPPNQESKLPKRIVVQNHHSDGHNIYMEGTVKDEQ